MRAHAHHQSELLVIVRDARGVREEKPLRVHAKFDDEEKMTVRVDLFFFLLLCVFLFLRSFVRWWRERLFNESLTRERTRAYLTDIFALSLSLSMCVFCSIKRENRKRRVRRRARNGTRRWFSGERRRR